MAPTRTQKAQHRHNPSSSTPTAGPSNPKGKQRPKQHHTKTQETDHDALPGVQKLKATLRQTRRLLAKDNLAADVRVATERRQRALEADLATAERVRKERIMAIRYHKIKFFERQKITRKIQQMKRLLSQTDGEKKLGKSERRTLEERLLELRVDLNYILHYPKMKKYISLFPPEVRAQGDPTSKAHMKQKEVTSETDAQREEVRSSVRAQMERGELSSEPENEVNHGPDEEKRGAPAKWQSESSAGHAGKRPEAKAKHKDKGGLSGDAFFGDDDEDEDADDKDEEDEESEGDDDGDA